MKKEINILIVSNDENSCQMLFDSLEKKDCKVTVANSEVAATQKIKEKDFNLNLVDLKFGLKALKAISEIKKEIMTIVVVDLASVDTAALAMNAGAYTYLTKPFNEDLLIMTIKMALKTQRLFLENRQLSQELKEKDEDLSDLNQYVKLRNKQIADIHKTYAGMLSSSETDKKFDLIVNILHKLFDAQTVSLMLLNEETGKLEIAKAIGLSKEVIENTAVEIGGEVAGLVAERRGPILVNNIEEDSRFSRHARSHYKSKSFMSSPLLLKGKIIGVLNCTDRLTGETFTTDDLNLLKTVSSYFASVVYQARLSEELSSSFQRLEKTSILDDLTDALNRRHFNERLELELERAKRYDLPLSLLMIGLDNFKSVNDMHGRRVGGFVLKELVRHFKSMMRGVDIVGRYGDEKFALLLPNTEIEGAKRTAERIRTNIATHTFVKDNYSGRLTINVGVASFKAGEIPTGKELIKEADDKLSKVKEEEHNRVGW